MCKRGRTHVCDEEAFLRQLVHQVPATTTPHPHGAAAWSARVPGLIGVLCQVVLRHEVPHHRAHTTTTTTMHACTHAHTDTQTQTQTHIHTHTHTRARVSIHVGAFNPCAYTQTHNRANAQVHKHARHGAPRKGVLHKTHAFLPEERRLGPAKSQTGAH